jgi:hypothetical protein
MGIKPLRKDKNDFHGWTDVKMDGIQTYYQVNRMGQVRRLHKTGYRILTPFYKHQRNWTSSYGVALMGLDGKYHFILVSRLVADAFLGGVPEGYSVCNINGSKTCNVEKNIGFESAKERSRKMLEAKKRVVLKIDYETGEVLDVYKGTQEAADANFYTRANISKICKSGGKGGKNRGFTFKYES